MAKQIKLSHLFNIQQYTLNNTNYREVVVTNDHSQIVVMSLLPGEEIGMEVHEVDQFIRIEKGKGIVIVNHEESDIFDGMAISIPTGNYHNIINLGNEQLKLYTIYSPPNEEEGLIQRIKPID
jgi:mannose-6-phosphate isomerase-like protein (cupin superfamily)